MTRPLGLALWLPLLLLAGFPAYALKPHSFNFQVTIERPTIVCKDTSGTDLAAKLNSCLDLASGNGAILDTTGFKGRQELAKPFTVTKPVRILIGCSTWVLGAELRVGSNNVSFAGSCEGDSVIRRAPDYSGRLITYASPGHSGLEISGITFDGAGVRLKNTDSSVMVYLHSGSSETYLHHNRFVNLDAGRAISSGGSVVAPHHVRIEQNSFSGEVIPAVIAPGGAIRHSGVVKVTTVIAHGLGVGAQVYVSGTTDASFAGVFTITAVPSPDSLTYVQNLPDATSGSGTASPTNLRAISLVTPGVDVQIKGNTIVGVGSISLEPSSEAADGDIEISGNALQNVDASNILVRTHDNTRIENVRVFNNHIQDAGLRVGKGCIVVGENSGVDSASAYLRRASITDNNCRGWGNWTGPSIGISVAGATGGATVQEVTISGNVLDARRTDAAQTASGYGIFVRNNTDGFQVTDNRVSYSGRSCVTTSFAKNGVITGNTCEFAVRWSEARNPSSPLEGCYQVDRGSSSISITANRCTSPGTPSGPSNGYFIADSDTISAITLQNNTVLTNSTTRRHLLRNYQIGAHARNVRVIPGPLGFWSLFYSGMVFTVERPSGRERAYVHAAANCIAVPGASAAVLFYVVGGGPGSNGSDGCRRCRSFGRVT